MNPNKIAHTITEIDHAKYQNIPRFPGLVHKQTLFPSEMPNFRYSQISIIPLLAMPSDPSSKKFPGSEKTIREIPVRIRNYFNGGKFPKLDVSFLRISNICFR